MTSYRESEKLLEDPVAAEGDFKIAEGLKFTNKAASGVHGLAVKVRWLLPADLTRRLKSTGCHVVMFD